MELSRRYGCAVVYLALCVLIGCELLGQSSAPLGSMRLLPGYTHGHIRGIDSKGGVISKLFGPTVHYEVGSFGYQFAANLDKSTVRWSKKQRVGDSDLEVTLTKDGMLGINFDGASFAAQNIHSAEHVAEILLMVMTYKSDYESFP
jgi:hypothetical protein